MLGSGVGNRLNLINVLIRAWGKAIHKNSRTIFVATTVGATCKIACNGRINIIVACNIFNGKDVLVFTMAEYSHSAMLVWTDETCWLLFEIFNL